MHYRPIATVFCAALLAAAPVSAQQRDSGYLLGPEDQIAVNVFGQPELSVKTRIKPGGTITLPVIGTVTAEGETAQGLAEQIGAKLRSGGVVREPIVSVEIEEFVSRAVTALGALGQPGIYPLDRPQTISTLLARAGGVRPDGGERVTLRRAGAVSDIDVATLTRDPLQDIALQPGDVVYVAPQELFYVYGQVNTPGGYPMVPQMTLRQALARSGGPTLAGTERRVTLHREGQPPADANLDDPVRKGDVLVVRERLF